MSENRFMVPEDYETGDAVKTPRSTFYITEMSVEEMRAAGYGYHHTSSDGSYFIMCNGTKAYAIHKEENK